MLKQKTGNTVLCSTFNDIQQSQSGNCLSNLMKCYFLELQLEARDLNTRIYDL